MVYPSKAVTQTGNVSCVLVRAPAPNQWYLCYTRLMWHYSALIKHVCIWFRRQAMYCC